uniref:Uncharacterized protein n=1 Tax=Malurus cyaneus samueli TaxID=2593467 RepID=A0A8C5TCZ4_9PASS
MLSPDVNSSLKPRCWQRKQFFRRRGISFMLSGGFPLSIPQYPGCVSERLLPRDRSLDLCFHLALGQACQSGFVLSWVFHYVRLLTLIGITVSRSAPTSCRHLQILESVQFSQVPLGKRLRNISTQKTEGRVIMTRVQKMNWKTEARCLECTWRSTGFPSLTPSPPEGTWCSIYYQEAPKSPGLYAIGYEECHEKLPSPWPRELEVPRQGLFGWIWIRPDYSTVTSHAEVRTLQQCLFLHFQANTKTFSKDWVGINAFLSQNCVVEPGVFAKSIYIKFVEVERDFLSAGSLVECLEKPSGTP